MLKEFLWNTFEKTGSLEAYVFIKEIEGIGVHHENNSESSNAVNDKTQI